jgi:hypothetical protein
MAGYGGARHLHASAVALVGGRAEPVSGRAFARPVGADPVASNRPGLRKLTFQRIAYARPVQWTEKGDNKSAVIFINVVEGDRFKQIDQIGE